MSEIDDKYIVKHATIDPREKLNQNLQPDVQKIDSIIRKINGKKAPVSELRRLDGAVKRLQASIDLQIRSGD